MVKNIVVFISVLLLLSSTFITSGCATLADAKNEKGIGGDGTIKTYDSSFKKTWDAVVDVVENSSLEIVSANENTGELLAEKGVSLFSYGEKVAIYVNELDHDSRTQVEVISKRALATNITATNWETKIFEALDNQLQAIEQN